MIFQPILWLGLNLFGQSGFGLAVRGLNYGVMKSLLILGVVVKFEQETEFPKDASLIVVANHQSVFDISPISWYMRKLEPKFVAKIELATGIPSISYNLRHGGMALIDRNDRKQSIIALSAFAKKIRDNRETAVIFPEGTRSRTGIPKKFQTTGLKILLKNNPDAFIIPVSISNSWRVFSYGYFPFGVFFPIKMKFHAPISIANKKIDELLDEIESIITKELI